MNTVKNIKSKVNWISDLSFNQLPRITDVAFIKDEIAFVLDDERIIYIPLEWSKKLKKAKPAQRANYKTNGVHVFWDDVDILFGKELFL
jgi:hypothetical protein